MLKNTFRRVTGVLLLAVFGVAIWQFFRQTAGNEYVGGAVAFGAKVLLFIALVLWLVYLYDRRLKKNRQ